MPTFLESVLLIPVTQACDLYRADRPCPGVDASSKKGCLARRSENPRFEQIRLISSMEARAAVCRFAMKSASGKSTIVALTLLFLMSGFTSVSAQRNALPRVSFGAIQNLRPDTGASTAPVVATVGSNVYVAWADRTTSNGRVNTFFTMSNASGAAGTWSPITDFSGHGLKGDASPHGDGVQIAAEGQYVFLTWEQGKAAVYVISADSGKTFIWGVLSAGAPVGKDTGEAVTASGRFGYFTWSDKENGTHVLGEIFMVVAEDTTGTGNFTLSSPVILSTGSSGGPTNNRPNEDESASVGNFVYVVWDSIWFTSSTNNGQTWSTPKQLKPGGINGPGRSREPMISASGTDVYVTFPSNAGGPYEAYTR